MRGVAEFQGLYGILFPHYDGHFPRCSPSFEWNWSFPLARNRQLMVTESKGIHTLTGGKMKTTMLAILLLTFAVGTASAQTATPRVKERQVNQQKRIHQGVRSGELTRPEARRLELREAKIARDKSKAKSDGVVTPEERAKLAAEQNRTSRAIARQKHDAQTRK